MLLQTARVSSCLWLNDINSVCVYHISFIHSFCTLNVRGLPFTSVFVFPFSVTGENSCAFSSCSHLCLLSSQRPHFYSCACPSGWSLSHDSVTCLKGTVCLKGEPTIAQQSGVSAKPLDNGTWSVFPLMQRVSGVRALWGD